MLKQLKNKGRRDLVRRVSDANIEEWELNLYRISADQLELILVAHNIYTLCDFSHHSGVHLNRNDLLATLEESGCQVTCAGSDFKDNICCLNSRFFNNLLYNKWILEDMLTERFVKCEVVVFVLK